MEIAVVIVVLLFLVALWPVLRAPAKGRKQHEQIVKLECEMLVIRRKVAKLEKMMGQDR